MGTTISQRAIVGQHFEVNSLKVITEPAQFKDEPRFDTKTGYQTHTERVTVKHEVFHYELYGRCGESPWELAEQFSAGSILAFYDGQKNFYIGVALPGIAKEDMGKSDVLLGSIGFAELRDCFEVARRELNTDEIELYFDFVMM